MRQLAWTRFFRERILGALSPHDRASPPIGVARLWEVQPSGIWTPVACTRNTLMAEWGHIAARQIGFKQDVSQLDFAVRGMYIEYENVSSPGDSVTVPTFGAHDGLEYYDSLSGSASKDFLRVGLQGQPELSIASGFEDDFVEGSSGNKLSFFAMTSGTQGVHGKSFSNASNSKVYGAALVARPVLDDRTQDVLFARTYFDVADQTLKSASSQVGVSWDVSFVL